MVPSNSTQLNGNHWNGSKYLLLAATLTTLGSVVIGYMVRLSNSSLGCPDWPTCYGQWGLPTGANAQIQYAHRIAVILDLAWIIFTTVIAVLKYRRVRLIMYPLCSVLALSLVEVGVGRITALSASTPWGGPIHLALALVMLALMILATTTAFYVEKDSLSIIILNFQTTFKKLLLAIGVGLVILMTSGEFLVSNGNSLPCQFWIPCSMQLPGLGVMNWVPLLHSLLAGLVSLLIIGMAIAAWKIYWNDPVILTSATATTILYFSQVGVGALKVIRGFPVDLIGVHAITTGGLWAALCVLAVSAWVTQPAVGVGSGDIRPVGSWQQRLKDFFMLTKPLIVVLLLVTTVTGMVMGGKGFPSLHTLLWTLIGGAMAAGGSSAINQYIDRDLDKRMQRTAKRPVASGRIAPAEGLAFGVALCFLSFYVLVGFVNLLAALLSLAGMVYYVVIYSILLKNATVHNIVIGGGAGAIPPLVGWAAATGSLNLPSLLLFAIIFFWTPPHFWALALVRTRDYARAGVPMFPVIKGEYATRSQIFIYTLELVGMTFVLPLFKLAGSIYLVSALALGGVLIYAAWKVWRKGGNKTAWTMYRYSSMYLALLFFAMILDVLLRKPG